MLQLPGIKTGDIMPASDADEIMSHVDSLSDPYDVLKLLSDKLGNEGNIKDVAHISFFRR